MMPPRSDNWLLLCLYYYAMKRLFMQITGMTLEEIDALNYARIMSENGEYCDAARCGHCGFAIVSDPEGVRCKSGNACPFDGQALRYVERPDGVPNATPTSTPPESE